MKSPAEAGRRGLVVGGHLLLWAGCRALAAHRLLSLPSHLEMFLQSRQLLLRELL